MKPSVFVCALAPFSLLLSAAAPVMSAPAAPAPLAAAAAPAGVAATVNGEPIKASDVERGVKALTAHSTREGLPAPNAATLAQYRATVLEVLIAQRLMAQEAARRKFAPTAEQLNTMLADFKQGNNLKDDNELKAFLARDGKTPDDLRRLLSEQLSVDKLASGWVAPITATDADVADFYTKNPDAFRQGEQVRARHILLAVKPGATGAERARIQARAAALFKQASAKGANFAALAKANSDDPGSKDEGGDVGWFGRNMMVKQFEDAAFGAPVGAVVGPVQSDFGYHILKIEGKRAPQMVPLAEVKDDPRLKTVVLAAKKQAAVDAEVAKLKAAAQIQTF